ncbi:uncharacterized protein DAT39_021720, partial [Clarias magur]
LLSAEPEISVSGPVGSTAVLPCELTSVDTHTLYIRWNTESEIVFERLSEKLYHGEGYEGRVDVPVEKLRKGNCSLVLHNLRLIDTGVYSSYLLKRPNNRQTVKINSVNLTVYENDHSELQRLFGRVFSFVFTSLLTNSVESQSVSVKQGFTAVLPCKCNITSVRTLHVRWSAGAETVFERLHQDVYEAEGYQGRVDVPEDELRKGNCSLVLRNARVTDAGIYISRMKRFIVQSVELSIHGLVSAELQVDVSGPVGSTAVLPCELLSVDPLIPNITWLIKSKIVFRRLGENYPGEGYEGRVDVPVEELRKGNCSLVLRNLTPTDTGVYTSHKTVMRTKRETFPISRVNLTVHEPEISVSGPVGSTAVLPCELTSVDTDTLYIRWNTESEIVFERLDQRSYQGEGYEGRVDVPVEELRKGNCSLVLHNLTFTDTGVYSSYQTVRPTNRETSVNLTVY